MIKIEQLVLCGLAAVALLATTGASALALELFRDEMNNGTAWSSNHNASTDYLITFNYDYGNEDDGIPEAPNFQGGDAATQGLKLEANLVDAAGTFYTLYPNGQNFTGSHRLRFDAWQNFDADTSVENGGTGPGTTEFLGGGLGYNGTSFDINSGAQALSTSDGDSALDWRAFKDGFFVPDTDMADGTSQGSDAHYADFLPKVAPPTGQLRGAGNDSTAGSPGFQWITWEFTVVGSKVRVNIEKPDKTQLRIVDIDCSDMSDTSFGCTTSGNISLFYADFFSSVTLEPGLTFGMIDNVVVSRPGDFDDDGDVDGADFLLLQLGLSDGTYDEFDLAYWEANFGEVAALSAVSAVPEPAACVLLILGAITLASTRRKPS